MTQLLFLDEVSLNTALDIVDKFAGCSGLRANFDKTQILNKFTGSPIEIDCLTICAILAKYYIYCCKIKKCMPNITSFKQRIKVYSSIELYSKYMYTEKKAGKLTARWSCLKQILDNS